MSAAHGASTRAIAIEALNHIISNQAHADLALDKIFHKNPDLKSLDRAFVFEIVYGALRWLVTLDWILKQSMTRNFSDMDSRVVCALRVGAYQIMHMDKVPHRSAVDSTVEAVKLAGVPYAASLVNAVLRRVSERSADVLVPNTDTTEYLSLKYSFPKWMIQRWQDRIPQPRLEQMLQQLNDIPSYSIFELQHNFLAANVTLPQYLQEQFNIECEQRPLKGCLRVTKLPNFSACPVFAQGGYMIQDEAAQLAAHLSAPVKDETILDCCAAPGGKTLALWTLGADPQKMTVSDASKKRMQTLSVNLARCNFPGQTVLNQDLASIEGFFDKILLDAPCSSMGVIGRHPEIKWHRSPHQIAQLAADQAKLLEQAIGKLNKQGELVYVVCTTEPEETTEQIQQFLFLNPEFQIVDARQRLPQHYQNYFTDQYELLILPGNKDSLDGFYAVVLKRRA